MSRGSSTAMICALVLLVSTAADATNTGTMGLTKGTPAAVTCPNQTYLAGFNVWLKPPSFSGLAPYCTHMASDGSWASGAQVYSDLMMSKGNGGTRLDMFCPFDFYVFGFQGYSMVYGINAIAQLTVTCKNAKTGVTTSLSTPSPDGVAVTEWPGRQCNNNSIAQGIFGLVDNEEIIQFGLSCAQYWSLAGAVQNKEALIPSKPPGGATTNLPNLANANRVIIPPAPVIISPAANSRAIEGKFQVKAQWLDPTQEQKALSSSLHGCSTVALLLSSGRYI